MPREHGSWRRRRRWLYALAPTILLALGMRHYRVDNSLAAWSDTPPPQGVPTTYITLVTRATTEQAHDLARALEEDPAVATVIDPASVTLAQGWTGISPEGFVVGVGGVVGVYAFPEAGANAAALMRAGEHAAAQFDSRLGTIHITGPAAFEAAINRESQRRMPAISLGMLLVGAIVMRMAARTWRPALEATGAMVVAQIAFAGLLSWLGRPMSMTLSLVPPMMLALGYSFAAHRAMRRGVGGALAASLATTVAGVGVFALSGPTPVREFGLFGAMGVILVGAAVWLLVRPCESRPRRASRIFAVAARRVERSRTALRAGGTALILAGLFAAPFVRIDANAMSFFSPNAPIRRDYEAMEASLTGGLPFFVEVESREGAPAFDPSPMIASISGVHAVMNLQHTLRLPQPVWWVLADNAALDRIEHASREWRRAAAGQGASLRLSGVAFELIEARRSLRRVAAWSLPAMVVLAALAAGCIARRIDVAIASAVVNAAPPLILAIIVALLGVRLTLADVFVGAIAVGVAVDDTILIASALRRRRSTLRALLDAWRPAAASTLAGGACFMLLLLSPFRPTSGFGALLASAMGIALLADMLLLPALLPRRIRDQRL